MVIKGFKSGYTLFEACVVMIIISIFIMVMANVVPHKVKAKVESNAHGHFECYMSNGRLIQQTFIEGNTSAPEDVTEQGFCQFTPQGFTRFLIFNAVGSGLTNSSGEFVSTFISKSSADTYVMRLGEGVESGNGVETVISEVHGAKESVILSARGGVDATDPANATIEDVSSCIITSTIPRKKGVGMNQTLTKELEEQSLFTGAENEIEFDRDYDCDKGPLCEIENGKIKVSYCRSSELYKTKFLPYSRRDSSGEDGSWIDNAANNYRASEYIATAYKDKNNVWNYIYSNFPNYTHNQGIPHWNQETSTITYCDTSFFVDYGDDPDNTWKVNENCVSNQIVPSMYKMQVVLDLTQNSGVSLMSNYIRMLQYPNTDPLAAMVYDDETPGPGDGVPNGRGGTGAVLILW